jgi:hypothetical protein
MKRIPRPVLRALEALEKPWTAMVALPLSKLGLKKARDTSTGAWTDGKRRIHFASWTWPWPCWSGFVRRGFFDAWYAARQVLEWLHAHGWRHEAQV